MASIDEHKKDNWSNRKSGMQCHTCIYFCIKTPESFDLKTKKRIIVGRCRRHAPTLKDYPVVFTNDWCGDHKLDENIVSE
jgi:hypothetical protein